MLTSIIFVVLFFSLLAVTIWLWAVFLRIGLRWVKVSDVPIRRVFLVVAIIFAINTAISVAFAFVSPASEAESIFLAFLKSGLMAIATWMTISSVFKLRFGAAFKAWLPTLCAAILVLALNFLVIRPLLLETFAITSNSMAPTLVGKHSRATCPECGETGYYTPADQRFGQLASPMICENFHHVPSSATNKKVYTGDRIAVAKFVTPRRWDLVVFQVPANPAETFVFRLVGLPGETVTIDGGDLWIDGEKMTPPDSLTGLEYLSQVPGTERQKSWGSVNNPAILGKDEYFTLGDFSATANDSRHWQGAPGYNSFAVPESNIKGVVTHTYWPLNRFRIHR